MTFVEQNVSNVLVARKPFVLFALVVKQRTTAARIAMKFTW